MYAPCVTRSHTRTHTHTHTHVRDGETARVSLNDQVCWKKTGITTEEGTQVCGQNQPKNEKKYPVYGCSIKFPDSGFGGGNKPLKIRVWTDLDEPLPDESFGIDNLVIERVEDTTTAPSACLLNIITCSTGVCSRADTHLKGFLNVPTRAYSIDTDLLALFRRAICNMSLPLDNDFTV